MGWLEAGDDELQGFVDRPDPNTGNFKSFYYRKVGN